MLNTESSPTSGTAPRTPNSQPLDLPRNPETDPGLNTPRLEAQEANACEVDDRNLETIARQRQAIADCRNEVQQLNGILEILFHALSNPNESPSMGALDGFSSAIDIHVTDVLANLNRLEHALPTASAKVLSQ